MRASRNPAERGRYSDERMKSISSGNPNRVCRTLSGPVNLVKLIWRRCARSEAEGGSDDGAVHVHIQPGTRETVVEVQAAKPTMQVDPGFERVVDRANHLPVEMGAKPEAADIAVGGRAEAVAEFAMIAHGNQRVRPVCAARDADRRQQPFIQRNVAA